MGFEPGPLTHLTSCSVYTYTGLYANACECWVREVVGHNEREHGHLCEVARLVKILTLLLIYSRSPAVINVHISIFLHTNMRNMEFMS